MGGADLESLPFGLIGSSESKGASGESGQGRPPEVTPLIWIPVLDGMDSYSNVRDRWDLWDLAEGILLVQWKRRREEDENRKHRNDYAKH